MAEKDVVDSEEEVEKETSKDYMFERSVEFKHNRMGEGNVYIFNDPNINRTYVDFVPDEEYDAENSGRFNRIEIASKSETIGGNIKLRQNLRIGTRMRGNLYVARIDFEFEGQLIGISQGENVTITLYQ